MKPAIVYSLLQSFDQLETAISSAEKAVQNGAKEDSALSLRFQEYRSSLQKQRQLAGLLAESIARGDLAESSRSIRLIKELSSMIRDDAKAILFDRKGPGLLQSAETPSHLNLH